MWNVEMHYKYSFWRSSLGGQTSYKNQRKLWSKALRSDRIVPV